MSNPPLQPTRVRFVGRALEDLRNFPNWAKIEAGQQLKAVQFGKEPLDWKPMTGVGPGVKEIRIVDAAGHFRVIYVAKFVEAVYVLHCFQKKSRKTSQRDIDLAASRYRQMEMERLE